MREEKLKERLTTEKLIGKDYDDIKETIAKWDEVQDIETKIIQKMLKGIESDESDAEKKEPERKSSKYSGCKDLQTGAYKFFLPKNLQFKSRQHNVLHDFFKYI